MSHPLIWRLERDADAIRTAFANGSAFLYPTEAVYGIGANPADNAAALRIIALKGRPAAKGMIITAGSWDVCTGYTASLTAAERALMDAINAERPTTFILPAGGRAAPAVRDAAAGRIALRISHHPAIIALSSLLQSPIISTSANPAGEAPARSQAEAHAYFPDLPCLAGSLGSETSPSRLMDWQTRTYIRT